MHKREQAFTTQFIKWLRHKWSYGSALFEVKSSDAVGNAIPFNHVQPHQIQTLLNARRFVYKLSDIGMVQMPCDVVNIVNGEGYLVFHYGGKEFYIVEINKFLAHRDTSTRKSITKEEAKSLASISAILA